MSTERCWRAMLVALGLTCPMSGGAQKPGGTVRPDTAADTSIAAGITAGEADGERRRRSLINAANLDLGFTTLRIGGGLLIDYIAYDQDSASREQFHLA